MRLFLAASYLNRSAWAGDGAGERCRYAFELFIRGCVNPDDGGKVVAGHVALYFEDVTDAVQAAARPLLPEGAKDATSFFVDVLSDGKHVLSVWGLGWYAKWSSIRVDLHEVLGTTTASIARAFEASASLVRDQVSYDWCVNLNSLFCWPCSCSSTAGCGCRGSGVTCVSAVLLGIAVARGVPLRDAEGGLRIPRRIALGARLPVELLRELVAARAVAVIPRVLTMGEPREASLPLLVIERD
jgi:hypothetical protein